jgi:hypothetical protein
MSPQSYLAAVLLCIGGFESAYVFVEICNGFFRYASTGAPAHDSHPAPALL